ncbi:hypothetical protein F4X86_00075 [Candidatus Saccharibacteria bacterium]|nr:hypothetical protein [Candidatus Saccharibacteria bacterium]
MSVSLSGRISRLPASLKFIIAGACLLAGFYLATSILMGLSAQTADVAPTVPEGYHTAADKYTYYNYQGNRDLTPGHTAANDAYAEHMDTHFKLFFKEEGGRLHISVNIPRAHYPAGIDRSAWRYSLSGLGSNPTPMNEAIVYSTVADPADCNNSSLSKYYRVPEDLAAETSWPLEVSDYKRYYCIRVNLKVDKPGFDYQPHRTFLADRAIMADGLNEYLDDFPGFSRTINQDTHYDDSGWFPNSGPSEFRNAYQSHLNNHFHLFSRYEDNELDLRFVLPGHFAIETGRDINDFSLEYIEYATVARRGDCDRDLFDDDEVDTTRNDEPPLSVSLTPTAGDYGRYYCVKTGIKGERTMSFDFNSYRIFYVPQIMINPDPDNVWLYF